MRERREIEEVDDEGRRRTETVSEEAPAGAPAGDGEARRAELIDRDEQVATTHEPGRWDLARGWVRTLSVWIVVALVIVQTLLLFRLGFLLANANPDNGFVNFIYDVSRPLVEPFEGIISPASVNGGVFDPATFIGMIVYLVVAILALLILWALTARPSHGDTHITSRSRHSVRSDVRGTGSGGREGGNA